MLLPVPVSAAVASAIRHPSPNTMRATPRTLLVDLHFMLWRMLLEVLAIISQFRDIVFLDLLQRVSQRHFTMAMVMPVRLAIRRKMNQLFPIAVVIERTSDPIGKTFTALQ